MGLILHLDDMGSPYSNENRQRCIHGVMCGNNTRFENSGWAEEGAMKNFIS